MDMKYCEQDVIEPKACTREYVPVCGKKNGEKHTFSNKCMMQAENAMYLYSGKCEQEVEEEDEISYQMSLKIKKLLKEFIAKLEERGYSDEKIVATIDAVMERLKELGKQDKYRAIVNYMIDILQEYREEYEDDFGILEDIFSDY